MTIEHQEKPKEVEMIVQVQKPEVHKTTAVYQQDAQLQGMRMDVEIAPQKTELTTYEVERKKEIQAPEHHVQTHELMISEDEPEEVKEEVVPQEVKQPEEAAPEAPRFITELNSFKVMDGQEIKFKIQVTGRPKPDVIWYHNNQVIEENPDFTLTYTQETGEALLHIIEVFPQDSGEYRCEATNIAGTAITRATLDVECKPGFHCYPSNSWW